MSISVNQAQSVGFLNSVTKNNKGLSKILEKLSLGKNITRASDDAAGLAIAVELESQVRGFRQSLNNAVDAESALNISDGATGSITGLLQRQRELAIQSANGTLNDGQRAAINTEYQSLQAEIDRVADSTQFNSQELSNGQGLGDGSAQFAVDPDVAQPINAPQVDLNTDAIGVAGNDVSTQVNAQASIASIDTALANVNTARANIGSTVNRLESAQNNITSGEINAQAAEAQIIDLDFAQGIMEKAKQELLSQTSIQALNNFNNISRNNLLSLLSS